MSGLKNDTETVFYSWQSDSNPYIGRYLIRDAIKLALKEISKTDLVESDRSLALDSDTLGESGSVPITETILKKIDKTSLFLADVTLVGVGVDGDNKKKHVNSNVMFEYGYAYRSLGVEHCATVWNSFYGSAAELPFNIRHLRHSIHYCLDPAATKADIKEEKNRLAEKLVPVLKHGGQQRSVEETYNKIPCADSSAVFWRDKCEITGDSGQIDDSNIFNSSSHLVYLRFSPTVKMSNLPSKVLHDTIKSKPDSFLVKGHGSSVNNKYGRMYYTKSLIPQKLLLTSISQVFETRELWLINYEILSYDHSRFHAEALRNELYSVMESYSLFLQSVLEYKKGCEVEIGIATTTPIDVVGANNMEQGVISTDASQSAAISFESSRQSEFVDSFIDKVYSRAGLVNPK